MKFICSVFVFGLLPFVFGQDFCSQQNAQKCLDKARFGHPECSYDYNAQACSTSVAADTCEAKTNQNDCSATSSSCLWDPYLGGCFNSLFQVKQYFECAYFTRALQPDGTNEACSWHGCAFDSNSNLCDDVTQVGSNAQTQTSSTYSSKVTWRNAQVLPQSEIFQVEVVIPYPQLTDAQKTPQFPIFETLQSVTDPSVYSSNPSANCSSFQSQFYSPPAPFVTSITQQQLNTALETFVNSQNNMNWNATTPDYSANAQQLVLNNPITDTQNNNLGIKTTNLQDVTNYYADPTGNYFTELRVNFGAWTQVQSIRYWFFNDGQSGPHDINIYAGGSSTTKVGEVQENVDYVVQPPDNSYDYIDVPINGLYIDQSLRIIIQDGQGGTSKIGLIQFFGTPNPVQQNYVFQPQLSPADQANALTVLARLWGYPLIGPGQFVVSCYADPSIQSVVFVRQSVLGQVCYNCANRGASRTYNSNGNQYILPESVVFRSAGNSFSQSTQVFTINVITTGQITIGATAQYHIASYLESNTYQQADCGPDAAREIITQRYIVKDVYDPQFTVGPRSISDITFNSPVFTDAGPFADCYGSLITEFDFLGCNYTNPYQCDYRIQQSTECRALDSTGDSFNLCSAGPTYNTGGGATYFSTPQFDGVHRFAVFNYKCYVNDPTNCTEVDENGVFDPTVISVKITSSDYLNTVSNNNPFSVQAGFLPLPTSPFGDYQGLSDTLTNTAGQTYFDGNVFARNPLNVIIKLPNNLLYTYDLRLLVQTGNSTFTPLDSTAVALPSASIIDITQLQSRFLYVPKNQYDSGCGAAGTCSRMPACIGVLGCDGFSVPVSQLISVSPGNGYQASLGFRIGLLNGDGTIPNARVLQSLLSALDEEEDDENNDYDKFIPSYDNSMQMTLSRSAARKLLQQTTSNSPQSTQNYYANNYQFSFRVINNNGTVTVIPSNQPYNGTDIADINVFLQARDIFGSQAGRNTFYRVVIPLFLIGLFIWFVVQHCNWEYNYRLRRDRK